MVAACADTDPTSRAPVAARQSDASDIAVPEASGDPASQTAVVVDGDVATDTDDELALPIAPGDSVRGADAGTGSEAEPPAVESTEAIAIEGFATDEPTFEVEPLRPFEFQVAEDAPPSGPGLDDAGSGQPTGWAAFDANLDAALLRNGNSAASVAVLIGGDVVHARGFGQRSPLFNTEITDTEDRFRIASISKTITAITLLHLVEDGVVGLDEEVGQRIADHLGVTPSNGTRRLTVRRLLSHTSGFSKYDTEFFRTGADSCDDAARTGMQRGAGSGGYNYSNMNYCVAGVLIEALTGDSYVGAAYEQVLTPLGLSGLRLANTFDPGPQEVLHATTAGRNYMETLGAAGSWIATPSDLVTILDSLDHSTPGFKPLEPETVLLMETPTGAQYGQRGYGLGVISYGDGRYGHTGTIENTHAMVLDRGDGVTWAITVAGPYPDDTPRLESIINRAFEAAGFISG
jgi:D-alanyl-D-alanine carboxypeptidase